MPLIRSICVKFYGFYGNFLPPCVSQMSFMLEYLSPVDYFLSHLTNLEG